jgi:DNA-directed RNA polymerase specialized sigma24 family protein
MADEKALMVGRDRWARRLREFTQRVNHGGPSGPALPAEPFFRHLPRILTSPHPPVPIAPFQPVEFPLDRFDVPRLIRNEPDAWREFVHAAAPLLRSIVRRTLVAAGRDSDTPDVLQEIFARLCRDDFRILRPFDPRKGRLSSWVAVIAARTAVDHLRAHRAAPPSLETLPAAARDPIDPAPPPAASSLSLPPDLLSPQQELILRLCYEDNLDVSDIATALRIQPQTVRAQRHKALARLRAFLAERSFF